MRYFLLNITFPLLNITFFLACALFLNRNVLAEEGIHCFILSGQSNMRGPLPESFRACVEQVFGKEKIVVVTVSKPSQPIKQWYKNWKPPEGKTDEKPGDNGQLYDQLLKEVIKKTTGKNIATATYIWMQGEADAGSGWGSVYEKSFYGILDQFKKDLKLQQINFVVGRINDFWLDPISCPDGQLIRTLLQKMGEENPNGGWINTDDLNRGVNPWGGFSFDDGHFPPPGYRVMGQRFSRKACLLINPKIELDPAIFTEQFFDAATQIKTHAAIGKVVTGSAPHDQHTANGVGLVALTDGKFGKEDPADNAWLGFAPSNGNIEFVLDLGEEQIIDAIAINTLLSTQAKAEFPDIVTYSTSVDGKNFSVNNNKYDKFKFSNPKTLQKMRSDGIKPQVLLLLTEQAKIKARYIKVEIKTGDQWVYLDEIIVNPKK